MARRNKRPWSPGEIAKVVAYLDFYAAKQRVSGTWSEEEVLRKIASHVKSRSKEHIRQKLLSLHEPNASTTQLTSREVFKQGIGCLNAIPDELLPLIYDTLQAIQSNDLAATLGKPQLLRSGKDRSASLDARLPHANKRTPSFARANPYREASTSSQARSVVKNNSFQKKDIDVVHIDSKTDGKGENIDNSNNGIEVADSIESSPLSSPPSSPPSRTETSEVHPPSLQLGLTKRKLPVLNDSADALASEYESEKILPLPIQASSSNHDDEALHTLLEDNKHFRIKCSQLEAKQAQQERANRIASSIRHLEKDPQFSLRAALQQKEQSNFELKQRLTSLELIRPDSPLRTLSNTSSDFDKVRKAFQAFETAVYCLAELEDFSCISMDPSKFRSLASESLLGQYLPRDFPAQKPGKKAGRLVEGTRFAMTAVLASAAVCEWVFMAGVHCAILLSTPIHESLRHHLRAVCGRDVARKLDVMAYKSILHGEDFQEVYLRRTAESLTQRLLEVVRDLYVSDLTPSYWGQAWAHMRSAFLHALTIKYELLLRDENFRLIWPATGSAFEEDLMQRYPSGTTQRAENGVANRFAAVQTTLVPGLQAYSCRKEHIHDVYFLKSGEDAAGEQTWILRATVLTTYSPAQQIQNLQVLVSD